MKFTFAGAMDAKSASLFERYKLKNVEHVGLLSYEEATVLQKQADVLLKMRRWVRARL